MGRTSVNAESIVRRVFEELLPGSGFDGVEDIPLAELGIDSLDFFEKLVLLEDEYGVSITVPELDDDVTLLDVLASIKHPSDAVE